MFLCNTLNKNIQPGVYRPHHDSPIGVPRNVLCTTNFYVCKNYKRNQRYIGTRVALDFYTVKYDSATKLFYPQITAVLLYPNGGEGQCESVRAIGTLFTNGNNASRAGTLTLNTKTCNIYSYTRCYHWADDLIITPGGLSANVNVTISKPLSTIIFKK
jgi:hypothetical protein